MITCKIGLIAVVRTCSGADKSTLMTFLINDFSLMCWLKEFIGLHCWSFQKKKMCLVHLQSGWSWELNKIVMVFILPCMHTSRKMWCQAKSDHALLNHVSTVTWRVNVHHNTSFWCTLKTVSNSNNVFNTWHSLVSSMAHSNAKTLLESLVIVLVSLVCLIYYV